METKRLGASDIEKPFDRYGAFLVGYYTAYAGIAFRAIHILHDIKIDSPSIQKDVVESQISRIRQNNPETVRYVLGVEALLRDAGLFVPARPHVVATWYEWAIDARRAVAVAQPRESPIVRALYAGEAYATLAAAIVLDDILMTSRDPSLPSLRDVARHRASHQEVERATEQLTESLDGQPVAFTDAAHQVVSMAKNLPSLDAPSERTEAVRHLVAVVNSKLPAFNEAYRANP